MSFRSFIDNAKNSPPTSEDYLPGNEESHDIILKCKSLLFESQIDSIRIIFHEIVDIKSIKREIFINGIVDMAYKSSYFPFLNKFQDYIADLDCFLAIPSLFKEVDKKFKVNNNDNFFDRVFYNNSFRSQNAYDINGNNFYMEDLLNTENIRNTYKFLIFWESLESINIEPILELANLSQNKITFFFISSIDNFIEKKIMLNEKQINYSPVKAKIQENNGNNIEISPNIFYIFDNRYLQSKYYVLKFPWLTIINKENLELYSSIFRNEEIESKINNFRNVHPTSVENTKNLVWVNITDNIKKSIIKEINEKLSKNGYKQVYFYMEMSAVIAKKGIDCIYNIDGYFIGTLKGQSFNAFKYFTNKICEEKKLKNIYYSLSD